MDIQSNLKEVRAQLPPQVSLVAVSKFHPNEAILAAYETGQRIFGESKEQELSKKQASLPADIQWHFIGHLQTNKVKYIAPYIAMIHAVDSYKLLAEIDKQAAKCNRVIPCLLEIHIAEEESKYGFSFEACREMLETTPWKELTHVCISGVMGMATNTDDESQITNEFESLHRFFTELKATYFKDCDTFKEIFHGHVARLSAGSSGRKYNGTCRQQNFWEIEYIKSEKNMAQLKSTFAGLTLNNPIIISSSGLTNSLAKISETGRSRSRCSSTEISIRRTNQHAGRKHAGLWLTRSRRLPGSIRTLTCAERTYHP